MIILILLRHNMACKLELFLLSMLYITSSYNMKNNWIKLKNEVGMIKSTQTRNNRVYYRSLRLLFLTISYAPRPITVDVDVSV